MYAESTRPSAKREVQKERSAKRDDRIALPRRAQTCELRAKRAMRMCPPSGQIFLLTVIWKENYNFKCITLLCFIIFYIIYSIFQSEFFRKKIINNVIYF